MGFFCGSCQPEIFLIPKDKRTKLREMDGDRPSSSASRIWIHPRRMLIYVFFPVMRQTLASLCPPLALQCGICAFIDPCPPKSLYRKWPSSSVVYLLHCQTLSPDGWWEWKCQINILIKTLSFTLTVRGRRRRHREFIFVYAKDLKYSNGNHPYP